MAKLISKTYGEALFELAVEENKTGLFLEEVGELLKVIEQNQDFGQFMNHPKIPKEEAAKIVERARVEAELEKKKMTDEVKREMIAVASVMAAKIVQANMDTNVQQQLIEETLKEIGDSTWLS